MTARLHSLLVLPRRTVLRQPLVLRLSLHCQPPCPLQRCRYLSALYLRPRRTRQMQKESEGEGIQGPALVVDGPRPRTSSCSHATQTTTRTIRREWRMSAHCLLRCCSSCMSCLNSETTSSCVTNTPAAASKPCTSAVVSECEVFIGPQQTQQHCRRMHRD